VFGRHTFDKDLVGADKTTTITLLFPQKRSFVCIGGWSWLLICAKEHTLTGNVWLVTARQRPLPMWLSLGFHPDQWGVPTFPGSFVGLKLQALAFPDNTKPFSTLLNKMLGSAGQNAYVYRGDINLNLGSLVLTCTQIFYQMLEPLDQMVYQSLDYRHILGQTHIRNEHLQFLKPPQPVKDVSSR